jgi:hypothetical protein
MSDPLTAFSLAASILQFIDFSSRLVSKGWQIYRNGASVQMQHVEAAVERLQEFVSNLQTELRPSLDAVRASAGADERQILDAIVVNEHALDAIAEKCSRLAGDLAGSLQAVKARGSRRRHVWKSFRQALKESLGKDGIKAVLTKLERHKEEIQRHLLGSLKMCTDLQAVMNDRRFSMLDLNIQVLIQGMLDGHDAMELALQRCTEEIIRRQRKSEQAILAAVSAARENELTVERKSVQDEVLDVLNFRRIHDRFDEIEQAHRDTFEWVFDQKSNPEMQWDKLQSFLETGRGCYWVSGKAGSGKSTLMKFICHHSRTKSALKTWAAGSGQKPLIPSFFFWSVGTTLQKSQTGLLRSLLYQILKEYRELIKVVLPGIYEQAAKPKSSPRDLSDPSPNELRQAFLTLASQRLQDLKICLFIDGIDEYNGETESLAELLAKMSSHEGIKIVLSSRPTTDCHHAFQHYPKLRLQDLTYGDIERFVNDKLRVHDKMRVLAEEKPTEAKTLVDSIVAKADGVFLWVRLVVSSLLRGLRNEDDIGTLQLRADECPDDLLKLYQHMFSKLERHYRVKAAEIFQIMRANQHGVLQTITLWFADRGDLESILAADPMPMPDETYKRRCDIIDHQLRSTCCGLLETRSYSPPFARPSEIRYLHKSVAEFVYSPEVWKEVVGSVEKKSFNPEKSLAQASLLHLRDICASRDGEIRPKDSTRKGEVFKWVESLVGHLQAFEMTTKKTLPNIVQAFGATVQFAIRQNRWHFKDVDRLPCELLFHQYFSKPKRLEPFALDLPIAVRSGCSIFVRKALDQQRPGAEPRYTQKELTQALSIAIGKPKEIDWGSPLHHRLIMIEALLRHGADPNAVNSDLSGFSAWETVLRMYRNPKALRNDRNSDSELFVWGKVLKCFLIHGANPNRPVPWLEEVPETPLYIITQSCFLGLVEALQMGEETSIDDWVVVGANAAGSAEERSPFTVELGTGLLEILESRSMNQTLLERLGEEVIILMVECAKKRRLNALDTASKSE